MTGRPRRHSASPRGGQPQNVVKRGSVKGHRSSDKRARQEANRDADGRRRSALEKVARERERLERRMAQEAENPTVGRVTGATWSARQREQEEQEQASARVTFKPRHVRLGLPAPDAQGNRWTMGQARSMLRAGYHLHRVQKVTGWGEKCFDDMKVDPDGYGLPIE